jgi:S1-C subfamily serine protease
MNDSLSSLSDQLARAVEQAAASVVQVHARRRPVAGVVFAEDLVLTPAAALDEDAVLVRRGDGHTAEGGILGRTAGGGMAVVRVNQLGVPPMVAAPDPRVGHLAVAVGRTWSGGVFATVTNVAVVGGPLRTGRATEIERVIRVAQPPHGALTGGALADAGGRVLGIITGAAIRGTTVVVPTSLAVPAAQQVVTTGGARQGFIGVSSTTVNLPSRQRAGRAQEYGLLITGLVPESPADAAGMLVGDIIIGSAGTSIQSPDHLVTLLRGDRVGRPAPVTVLRGGIVEEVNVTVGERSR